LNKISKLLLKSYAGPFLVSFIIAIFFFEMQFVWLWVDELMGKGLGIGPIFKLLFYFSANLVNFALPMAILMASLITMGNLAEHYELAAMKSGGLGLLKIMRPLVFLMVFVSIGAFFVANNVWPIANLKFKTLLYSIQQQEPSISIEENVFYNGIPGVSIRVDSKNAETNELHDVLIYDHRKPGEGANTVIRAERGVMQQTDDGRFLILTLHNGYSYDEQKELLRKKKKIHPHVKSQFEKSVIRVDLADLSFEEHDEDLFSKAHEMMTVKQLQAAQDSFDFQITKRVEALDKYFVKNHYITRDSLVLDTVAVSGQPFWATMSTSQQLRILDGAKRLTRQQQKYSEDCVKAIRDVNVRKKSFRMEWHRKFFFAFSCLVLFFIGAPLGAIIRKGGIAWPAVIALIVFVAYYILSIVGEKMAKTGAIEPWLGMWLSSIVLFPIGCWLTWKASRDSAVMDRDFYVKIFQKLTKRFTKAKKKIEDSSALS
jgi:lipopolysaccharide export system permease protein